MKRVVLILFVAAVYAAALGAIRAHAAEITPLITTGRIEERRNFVIFSEGYRTNEQAAFQNHSINLSAGILKTAPFSTNAGSLNFLSVYVPSAESGADKPSRLIPIQRDTFFDVQYDWGGNARVLGSSTAAAKLETLIKAVFGTNRVMPIILVNDSERGGSGGQGYVIVSRSSDNWQVAVHETGHVAGLGDEYPNAVFGAPAPKRLPNVAISTNDIPWQKMLTPGVGIPTKSTSANNLKIGVFQGAMYSSAAFRPYTDCAMRTQGKSFCPVCNDVVTRWILGK